MVEVAVIATLYLIWLFQKRFRILLMQTIFIGTGVLLPILVTCINFWSQGIFKEMFDSSIAYNLLYSGTKFRNEFILLTGIKNLGVIAWIGLLGYVFVLFHLLMQWRAGGQISALDLFLLLGFPLTVAVTDPAQRTYPHYYFINWLPYIASLTGIVVYAVQKFLQMDRTLSSIPEPIYLGGAMIIAIAVFSLSGLAIKNRDAFANLIRRTPVERNSVVSVYAKEHTRPDEQVLFWGGFPGENLMADRSSPSPYITYPLLLDTELSEEYNHQFLLDLMAHPPVLIVDMGYANALYLDPEKRAEQLASKEKWPDLWPYMPANIDAVLRFINDNYSIDHIFRNAVVYRLNGTSAP